MAEEVFISDAEIREILFGMWKEILGKTDIHEDDNFFELGGDSVQGMIAISSIRAQLGLDIPLEFIFEAATMGDLNNKILRLQDLTAPRDFNTGL